LPGDIGQERQAPQAAFYARVSRFTATLILRGSGAAAEKRSTIRVMLKRLMSTHRRSAARNACARRATRADPRAAAGAQRHDTRGAQRMRRRVACAARRRGGAQAAPVLAASQCRAMVSSPNIHAITRLSPASLLISPNMNRHDLMPPVFAAVRPSTT